jgi:hypothetical protein
MNASAHRPVAAIQTTTRGLWPKVSLHLPLRDASPEAVRRTLDSLAALDYPALEVLVVDTHTTVPALWEAAAEHCARLGPQFRFFHLGAWPGGRAGALNFALAEAAPDTALVGVLGAGQAVRATWLRRMVPLFRQAGLGLAQGALAPLDQVPGRFAPQHAPDTLLPLDGLPLFRVEALRRAGGWSLDSLCPEAALGVALLRDGWAAAWEAEPMGRADPPETLEDWPARRHRRVAGTTAALRDHAAALLRQDRSLTTTQHRHMLTLALPALLDALALAGVVASLAVTLLALWADGPGLPAMPLLPVLAALALLPLCHGWRAGWTGAVGQAAAAWGTGRAAWQGLLGGRTARASGRRLEAALTTALWGGALGCWLAQPWTAGDTAGWCALLLLQSLPGLAALVLTALPHRGAAPGRPLALHRHAA